MNILFFDTETTGFANLKSTPEDPTQPYLVQLGTVLMSHTGDVLSQVDLIVEPDGWIIPSDAEAVHGISQQMADACGVPLRVVMSIFANLCKKSDVLSAHNLDFDELIMRAQFHKIAQPEAWNIRAGHLIKVCTMKQATPHCKIPSPHRAGTYKWPSLEEASMFYLGKSVSNAHRAMSDCVALANIFGEMRKRGHIVGVKW
jgi:DNA polymerase-3 subunit epsilon